MSQDTTPAQEVKEEQNPQEVQQEESVAEILKEEPKTPDIPYHRFKEKVDEVATLKQQVEELQQKAKTATPAEVKADLESIAAEHNLDAVVLGKIASAIEARAERSIEDKLRPLTEAQQVERREKLFNEHLGKALENNPQYKDIANPEVIKALALNPHNAQMTISQLLEMAYGKVLETPGRKTLESTTPRGGGDGPKSIDMERAKTDGDYFKEVMSDPSLKKEYNEKMLSSLSRIL